MMQIVQTVQQKNDVNSQPCDECQSYSDSEESCSESVSDSECDCCHDEGDDCGNSPPVGPVIRDPREDNDNSSF